MKAFIEKPKVAFVQILSEFCEAVTRIDKTVESVQLNK
jgi:hypothetical protein